MFYREFDAEIDRLKEENKKLLAFAKEILENHPGVELNAIDIQDISVKHGLLIETTVYEPCNPEGCSCNEFYSSDEFKDGISCFRLAPFLKSDDKLD